MRTLLGLYGEYKWLISGDLALDTQRIITLYPYIANPEGPSSPLPVFRRPFLGPKMTMEDWDGAFMCVTSPIKDRVRGMHAPYILHLPFNDHSGRLRKGDYLLVEQAASVDASYVLIKSGWGVKLARRLEDGGFEDVESGERRADSEAQIIGNVPMILMGAL